MEHFIKFTQISHCFDIDHWHSLVHTPGCICGLCGAIGADDYHDVYSKPQCRRESCVPGLSLWLMWTLSCIFHNVLRVTLWQLLGRETMQGTLLVYSVCVCEIVNSVHILFFLFSDIFRMFSMWIGNMGRLYITVFMPCVHIWKVVVLLL